MVGNKSINPISVFSWADEVEKEEEEAQAQLHQQQKPNPFGSARPREVVLQEKGVDWRKIDRKLHESSNISYVSKKEKENIPAITEPTATHGKYSFPPRSQILGRNIENPRNGCDRNDAAPLLNQTLQNQNELFVPPLMFPPKNLMGQLNETQWSYNSYRPKLIKPSLHYFYVDNPIHQHGKRNFPGQELMHHHHQSIGEDCNVRIMRGASSAYKERELHNMNSIKRRTLFQEKTVGSPPFVNESRVAFLNHRDEEFDRKVNKVYDEFGKRRNSVMERLGPSPIEASTLNNVGGKYNKHRGGIRPSTTIKESEMESEYGKRRFHAEEFVDHSIGALQLNEVRRGKVLRNVDGKMGGFGGNYRKRGMVSGFNNNNDN